MTPDRIVREEALKLSDLEGIEEIRIATELNPAGTELSHKVRLIPDTPRNTRPAHHRRPVLTVFVDDPEDTEAGARIMERLGLSPDEGWY